MRLLLILLSVILFYPAISQEDVTKEGDSSFINDFDEPSDYSSNFYLGVTGAPTFSSIKEFKPKGIIPSYSVGAVLYWHKMNIPVIIGLEGKIQQKGSGKIPNTVELSYLNTILFLGLSLDDNDLFYGGFGPFFAYLYDKKISGTYDSPDYKFTKEELEQGFYKYDRGIFVSLGSLIPIKKSFTLNIDARYYFGTTGINEHIIYETTAGIYTNESTLSTFELNLGLIFKFNKPAKPL